MTSLHDFESFLRQMPMPATLTDPDDGRFLAFNDAFLTFTGHVREAVAGRTVFDIALWVNEEQRKASVQKVTAGKPDIFFARMRFASGQECDVQIYCSRLLLNGRGAVFTIFHDITEQQAANEALVRHSAMLQAVAQALPAAVFQYEVDAAGRQKMIYCSEGTETAFGRPVSEFLKDARDSKIIHPEDRSRFIASINDAAAAGAPWHCDFRVIMPDGSIKWLHGASRPMPNPSGNSTVWSGIMIEFTSRKLTQEAAELYKKRHDDLINNMPDVIMVFDREHRHLYVNPAVLEQTGIEPEKFIGKTHAEMGFPKGICDFLEEAIEKAFVSGKPVETNFDLPLPDRALSINWRLFPQHSVDGVKTVLAISRNVTAMRAAQRQYNQLFREMLDGFALHEIICDDRGVPCNYRFLAVNPAFERLTGLKAADILGKTVLDVLPGTEKYWIEVYGRVALAGKPASFEQFSSELGRYYSVRAFQPSYGQFATLFTDVTDRKQSEAIRSARHRISHATGASADPDFILRQMLDGVCGLPGIDAGWVCRYDELAQTLISVCHKGISSECEQAVAFFGPDTQQVADVKAAAIKIGRFSELRSELGASCANDDFRAFALLPLTFHGRPLGSISVASKTSETFPDETVLALRAIVYEIAAVVDRARVDASLRKALVVAESANRAKSTFFSTMSHEVRTPLNAILGFTDLALGTSLTKDQRQFLEIVKGRSLDLLKILNEILDLTKLQTDGIEIASHPFEPGCLLKELEGVFAQEIEKKQLDFAFSLDASVPGVLLGDVSRLKQVLINLLGNAVKFTEQGSVKLSVELAPGEQPGGAVRLLFKVADTGVGIEQDKRKAMFDPFVQADASSTRRYGGTGLGLTVASRLIVRMGGAIWVESELGKGSTFFFTVVCGLPPASAQSIGGQASPESSESAMPKAMSLLVVDDDADALLLATRILQGMGYLVEPAVNGQDALDKLETRGFDAVFMDVRMPVLDGLEATRRIRSSALPTARRDVPVIAMTANAMPGDERACLDAGMSAYIPKPITADDIRFALARVLPGCACTGRVNAGS